MVGWVFVSLDVHNTLLLFICTQLFCACCVCTCICVFQRVVDIHVLIIVSNDLHSYLKKTQDIIIQVQYKYITSTLQVHYKYIPMFILYVQVHILILQVHVHYTGYNTNHTSTLHWI